MSLRYNYNHDTHRFGSVLRSRIILQNRKATNPVSIVRVSRFKALTVGSVY